MIEAKVILQGVEASLIDETCVPGALPQILQEAYDKTTTPAAKYKIGEAIALAEAAESYDAPTIRQHLLSYVVVAIGLVEAGR